MEHKETAGNSIFIGVKPIKNYLNSINMQLKKENENSIILKARGKFISKAVDVAELAKRNPHFNLNVSQIKINTEEYKKESESQNPEKNLPIKVSTIEIHMVR